MNNLYEALKEGIQTETKIKTDFTNIEEAYEQLYQLTSRLIDMDDFSVTILSDIKKTIDSGVPIEKAFQQIIDTEYSNADYDYFKEVISLLKDDLKIELDNALSSNNPVQSWRASLQWMFDHLIVSVNDTTYTIDQLQKKIEGGNY